MAVVAGNQQTRDTEPKFPQHLAWPNWNWRFEASWLIISFMLGYLSVIGLFFSTQAIQWGRDNFWSIVVWGLILSLVVFVLIALLSWFCLTVWTFIKRGIIYGKQYAEAERVVIHLDSRLVAMNTEWQDYRSRCEETLAYYEIALQNMIAAIITLAEEKSYRALVAYHHEGDIFLRVHKKPEQPLEVGDALGVIDTIQRRVLGRFVVLSDEDDGYHARSIGQLDRMWGGFIFQHGQVTVPPTILAILVERRPNKNV
jgi:hypothetical protein